MMSRNNDLVRFMLIAKLSSMKKTAICPRSLAARAFSCSSSFDNAFVRTEPDRVTEELLAGVYEQYFNLHAVLPKNSARESPFIQAFCRSIQFDGHGLSHLVRCPKEG